MSMSLKAMYLKAMSCDLVTSCQYVKKTCHDQCFMIMSRHVNMSRQHAKTNVLWSYHIVSTAGMFGSGKV